MLELIVDVIIAVVAFAVGMLFGRANKRKVEALYQAAKKAEAEAKLQFEALKAKNK